MAQFEMPVTNRLIFLFLTAGVMFSFGYDTGYSQDLQQKSLSRADERGAATLPVRTEDYGKVFYVSVTGGKDVAGMGTLQKPFQSITFALGQIGNASRNNRYALFVAEGYYGEQAIRMKEYVDIFGGFSAKNWERDIHRHVSELNGESKDRLIIASDNAQLDGFLIRDGRVRGNGGAILCDGASPVISNNIFMKNKTLGPENWEPPFWHLKAHDGGAIYAVNGAAPKIEYNNFISNFTENGRGGGVACHAECNPVITHNIFANNTTGLKDPMRSSDGGAISVFDWCSAQVENNLIMDNRSLANNDGGGVFLALWSSAEIRNNIFLNNESGDDAGALFVGGQEHRYDSPLDTIPAPAKFYVNITNNVFMGNRNPSGNSGAMRFTMESRGSFRRNLVVHNTGIYFQRSEVAVEENIILDNFLFIETKEGLAPGKISKNMIWGQFDLQTEARVSDNNLRDTLGYPGNFSRPPRFSDDFIKVRCFSGTFSPDRYTTALITAPFPVEGDSLRFRVIRAGEKWGIVRDYGPGFMTVWGNLSGESELIVLPDYNENKNRGR